jgi:fructose 1,6-bisphosphate aldolase/phosphatase
VHTTVSVIKADVGSLAGHVKVSEELLKLCEISLSRALKKGVIKDFRVTSCGDDIELIMKRFEPVE